MKNKWLRALCLHVLSATVLVCASTAWAETVLLSRGQGEYGLGWLFRQQDGSCRVATPRHVIESAGRLIPADMLDRYGRAHATFDPVAAPTPDIDLAFLDVRGTLAHEGCSSSRLSAIAVRSALDRMERGILSIATPFDRQTLHIERRATSVDAAGGLIVAVGPAPGQPALMQGMSGGTIMVDNRPVAMLIEVDTSTGTGIALRFDVIVDELNKLTATPYRAADIQAEAVISELMLIFGDVARANSGAGTFLAGQADLVLAPKSDRIGLTIRLARHSAVNGVTIAATAETQETARLIVEVADGPAGFVPAQFCEIALSGSPQLCTFSARKIDRLRITAPSDSPSFTIQSLAVSGPDQQQ